MATERGRKTRPDLKVGICGEHGGEPSSVEFCHQAGLDYVSCSPFHVLTARLAAAQAGARETLNGRLSNKIALIDERVTSCLNFRGLLEVCLG